MALDAATAQEMLKKLAEDRTTYLETISRTHDLLARALETNASGSPQQQVTWDRIRRNTGTTLATTTTATADDIVTAPKDANFSIEEDSDTDDDESLFVQQTLPAETFDEEGLRKHIQNHAWTGAGKSILRDIIGNDAILKRRHLLPVQLGPVEDRSHLSHYSIFDVGNDGAPLPILIASERSPLSRSVDIWKRISSINANPARQKQAVGRITIVREPSPLLFAALHYTMLDHFDMDRIFEMLEASNKTKAFPPNPWAENPKHRNTFIFTLDYFTIVGDECVPMKWQKSDEDWGGSETHVPVTRCSSVVALSLEGAPVTKIRHRGRRNPLGRREGEVFDPFSPWHVLSMQAYPDWRSSVDSHDSTKHYVNGPEAFLMTIRAEFKDAQKRLMDVYNRISDLVRTPSDFMFVQAIRDKLLFEDDEFTFSRRYFWAFQSLAIMNEDIKEMTLAYKKTFTESVWNGTSKIIWPYEENSARNVHWRKRMQLIRKDIERELQGLDDINKLNDEKMKEIKALRDNLFSGTSVLESRKSVQQQAITVIQGNNIKILTLVTIFFLPLTFVTSVFGMTNMDPNEGFKHFGIVTVAICLPTYMLIGSLNTERGFDFWTEGIHMFFTFHFWKHVMAVCLGIIGVKPQWASKYRTRPDRPRRNTSSSFSDTILRPLAAPRSQSAMEGMAARGGMGTTIALSPIAPSGLPYSMSPAVTLERQAAVKFEASKRSVDSPRSVNGINSKDYEYQSARSSPKSDDASWFSRLFGRKAKKEANESKKEYP